MAKKEKKKSVSQKRFSPFTFLLLFLGIGLWWVWQSDSGRKWKENIIDYIDNRDLATLEARFTPEQILALNRQEILGKEGDQNSKRVLKQTTLVYYPYLLLNVKYTADQNSREGVLLWGLNDGEVVLNTNTWEKTHGFDDCLECNANRQDLRILQTLAKKPAGMTVEEMQKSLGVEREELISWLENTKQKYLIAQQANVYQLHFQNPKLLINPQTQINHPIVLKSQGTSIKAPRNYTRNQIIFLAKATFGNSFTIRSEEEIYLPVYRLEIINPDESIQTSEWNALTGKQIMPDYLAQSV